MDVSYIRNKTFCVSCGGLRTFTFSSDVRNTAMEIPEVKRAMDYPELFFQERICACQQVDLVV